MTTDPYLPHSLESGDARQAPTVITGELVHPPAQQPRPAVPPQPYTSPSHAPVPHHAMPPVLVLPQIKSVGVSLVLTFFFGAFGMFYSTVTGALVMLGGAFAYAVLTGILSLLTFGAAAVVMVPLAVLFWPAQMIWGAVAASQHNARVQAQAAAYAASYGHVGPYGYGPLA